MTWDLRNYEPSSSPTTEGNDIDEGLSNQPEDDDDDSSNT